MRPPKIGNSSSVRLREDLHHETQSDRSRGCPKSHDGWRQRNRFPHGHVVATKFSSSRKSKAIANISTRTIYIKVKYLQTHLAGMFVSQHF